MYILLLKLASPDRGFQSPLSVCFAVRWICSSLVTHAINVQEALELIVEI